jgi:hypothetical protein
MTLIEDRRRDCSRSANIVSCNCGRITGNAEVIRKSPGLVPINALVLTEPSYSRMVGKPEVGQKRGSRRSLRDRRVAALHFPRADFWPGITSG